MTPSQYCKAQGLPSLVYVAGKVNKDPRTIYKWHRDNFPLFEAVVAGVLFKRQTKGIIAQYEEQWNGGKEREKTE